MTYVTDCVPCPSRFIFASVFPNLAQTLHSSAEEPDQISRISSIYLLYSTMSLQNSLTMGFSNQIITCKNSSMCNWKKIFPLLSQAFVEMHLQYLGIQCNFSSTNQTSLRYFSCNLVNLEVCWCAVPETIAVFHTIILLIYGVKCCNICRSQRNILIQWNRSRLQKTNEAEQVFKNMLMLMN